MRLQFTLLIGEKLTYAGCKKLMEEGDVVHIVPDQNVVLFNCWDCIKHRQEQESL